MKISDINGTNKARKIKPAEFIEAWCAVWERDERDGGYLAAKMKGRLWAPITEHMLTCDNSFLRRVGYELGINDQNGGYIAQDSGGFFKLDMAFVTDYKSGYPTFIDVMIEHETQRKTIENEMWKLIFLRSPLKVLITYSRDPEAEGYPKKLLNMLNDANQDFPENENTTYLFIFGRSFENNMDWQWCSDKCPTLNSLC